MDHCFYAADLRQCEFYPRCSTGYLESYGLWPGETLGLTYHGPCLLYIECGTADLRSDHFGYRLWAPDFVIIPDTAFNITAAEAGNIHIFRPEILKMVANKLNPELDIPSGLTTKNLKPVGIADRESASRLSYGIMPERLRCRQYASIKLQEVVFTVRPGLHGAIGKVLSSKNWFFRLRVERLFDTSSRISEFATALGLSDSGFCKAFRRVYGHSFYRWYQSRRLESIMENMARYEYSLRELAVKHGFNSVQHLGYFIKKSTGLSAGRLRREIQKEPARFLKAEDQQP